MDYLSTKQVSEKWSVSVRRILKLCEDGRIKGAIKLQEYGYCRRQ